MRIGGYPPNRPFRAQKCTFLTPPQGGSREGPKRGYPDPPRVPQGRGVPDTPSQGRGVWSPPRSCGPALPGGLSKKGLTWSWGTPTRATTRIPLASIELARARGVGGGPWGPNLGPWGTLRVGGMRDACLGTPSEAPFGTPLLGPLWDPPFGTPLGPP